MKKKNIFAVCLAFFSLILAMGVCRNNVIAANVTGADKEEKAISIVESLTDSYSRSAAVIVPNSLYKEAFAEELIAVGKDSYVYLFTEELNVKAILLTDEANQQVIGEITSEDTAITAVKEYANKVMPDFFEVYDCDVLSSAYGEGNAAFYSIELWQKISDSFYTGNKIAVIVNADGTLQSFVSVNSDLSDAVMTYANEDSLSEEAAIGVAYDALTDTVEQLEKEVNVSYAVSPEKTGTDIIISDFGEEVDLTNLNAELPKYEIMIENTADHEVVTYREIKDGSICWVVKISNVETSRVWDMGFEVTVDAQSGNVLSVSNTR